MRIKMKIGTKALLLISSVTFIIFSAAIGYITLKSNQLALKDAMELSDSYAREYANLVMSDINVDMNTARAMAGVFKGYKDVPYDSRIDIYVDILKNIANQNPNFLSVWANWELSAIDSNHVKPFGRARFTVYRNAAGNLLYYTDTLNLDGDDINSAYYQMKVSKLETVMEPYEFSYQGSSEVILETSVCAPVLDEGKFVALAGIDLGLDRFDEVISGIRPFEGSNAFLVSNQGVIITHHDNSWSGKHLTELFPEQDKLQNITDRISKGHDFSVRTKNNRYISFASFTIGKTQTPWSLAIDVPIKIIVEKARRHLRVSIIVGIIGLILLSVFIWMISQTISRSLISITGVVKKMAKGEIDEKQKLEMQSGDELEEIAESVNKLIDGLNTTAQFASEIGKGNLNAEFELLSDKDILGNSLLEMRKSLIQAREDENKRKIEDEKQNWTTHGMNKFSEILRQNNDNIKELSFQIMSNLIEYVEAIQGALFVVNTSDEEDKDTYFELTSAIAYGRERLMEKKINIGDGLVGRCAFEKLTIYMTEIPEEYVNITSGLGHAKPQCILIVPLMLNEEVFGVIELISFNAFEKHQIAFVEQLGTSIASTISTVKVNEKTARLLEQSQKQAEELSAQEEEMRQNLEELQATQEEAARRENEMSEILKALNENLLVMELDMEGRIRSVNESFCQLLGMTQDQIINRKQIELPYLSDEDVRKYNDIWVYLKDGISRKEVTKIVINDEEIWLSETFTPILDQDGKAHKVLNMAINITQSKLAELEHTDMQEKLKEKEEGILLKDKELKSALTKYESAEKEMADLKQKHQEKIATLQDNFEKQLKQTQVKLDKALNELKKYKK